MSAQMGPFTPCQHTWSKSPRGESTSYPATSVGSKPSEDSASTTREYSEYFTR